MTSITTSSPVVSAAPVTAGASPVDMETFAQMAISGDGLQTAMGATLDDMFGTGGPGANATATSMVALNLQSSQLELTTTLFGSLTSSFKDQIKKIAEGM